MVRHGLRWPWRPELKAEMSVFNLAQKRSFPPLWSGNKTFWWRKAHKRTTDHLSDCNHRSYCTRGIVKNCVLHPKKTKLSATKVLFCRLVCTHLAEGLFNPAGAQCVRELILVNNRLLIKTVRFINRRQLSTAPVDGAALHCSTILQCKELLMEKKSLRDSFFL
jgi:hypothetical protein